jgi:hypothetical protein
MPENQKEKTIWETCGVLTLSQNLFFFGAVFVFVVFWHLER